MQVSVTISVEILKKTRYKQIKEKTMIKKAKDPKAVPELGVGKDGYKTGGVKLKLQILLKLKQ